MRRCSFVASFRINTDVDRKCQTIIFFSGKKIGSRSHDTVVENLKKVSYSILWFREIRESVAIERCSLRSQLSKWDLYLWFSHTVLRCNATIRTCVTFTTQWKLFSLKEGFHGDLNPFDFYYWHLWRYTVKKDVTNCLDLFLWSNDLVAVLETLQG